jgi:hypothetical protein
MPYGQYLSRIADSVDRLQHIDKENLHAGDRLFVQTNNSSYSLRALSDGWFEITGGWFDRQGNGPKKIRINGCTWGGKAIQKNIAAACGLCIEFSNRVVTSPVKKIVVIPTTVLN